MFLSYRGKSENIVHILLYLLEVCGRINRLGPTLNRSLLACNCSSICAFTSDFSATTASLGKVVCVKLSAGPAPGHVACVVKVRHGPKTYNLTLHLTERQSLGKCAVWVQQVPLAQSGWSHSHSYRVAHIHIRIALVTFTFISRCSHLSRRLFQLVPVAASFVSLSSHHTRAIL